jgi:hypothetical protein
MPRSTVFKVPHHGSQGAHYDGQWETLLRTDPGPTSVVTRFSASGLPRATDLRRIDDRSTSAFLCGYGTGAQRLAVTSVERRAMTSDGATLVATPDTGHVRLRRLAADSPGTWAVEMSPAAVEISPRLYKDATVPKARQRSTRRRSR